MEWSVVSSVSKRMTELQLSQNWAFVSAKDNEQLRWVGRLVIYTVISRGLRKRSVSGTIPGIGHASRAGRRAMEMIAK
jgi:hypothetical protein